MALALQLEAVPDAALDLGDAVQHSEGGLVLLASEGGGHAGEVADRGDGDTNAGAEVLPRYSPPQVVEAAGAGRLGNDLQLAEIRPKLEHVHVGERPTLLPVSPLGVQLVESEVEPAVYTDAELASLAELTGIALDELRSPHPNADAITRLQGRLGWFFDVFLERPELQEVRDGKVAADLLLKALQKAIDAAPKELRIPILEMSDERRGEMADDVTDETELL